MQSSPVYPAQPGTTAPRIGEWLTEALNLFQQEWKVWVAQGAIFFGASVVPPMVAYFVFYFGMLASLLATAPSSSSNSSGPPPGFLAGLFIGGGVFFLVVIASAVASVYLALGMKHTAAMQLRGQPIAVRDILGGGHAFLPAIGIGLLTSVGYMLGLLLFVIPGLVFIGVYMARWCYALPIAVEKRVGALEAMRMSWEATREHYWMHLLWFFVISIIGSLGAYACYVGMAATYPIMMIAWMISYRDVVGLEGALPPAQTAPVAPPPISNYGPAGPAVSAGPCPSCGRPVARGAIRCPGCQAEFSGGFQG